ncbi:Protein of unknown function [Roseateles sp. YR242]|uniref:DUF2946 domain-containing protein n=1 Tax=Roseateles sp. YR242 TaxID=1855305 RepID=UPI0008D06766|nr:DUF2946 domain-containing protein [Roseateles sp. YR242]SEL11440.1 Protein of unknown function [Roseateles sp. YR242]
MTASRLLFKRLAWIVSFTILLGALLPSLLQVMGVQVMGVQATASQAMGSPQASGFAEICSAAGATMVLLTGEAADADHGKSTPGSSSSMNCPCCTLHHGAPSLPPSALVWVPPAALRFEAPHLFLQSPRPLFAWAPVLARGPPSAA